MADITMSLDDTLELDTIIQQDSTAVNPIGTVTEINDGSTHNNNLSGFQKKTAIFDPPKSGVFKIPINGQELKVEVIDSSTIQDSEANQKLIHRWVLDDVNDTVKDYVGSATGNVNGATSVNGNWVSESATDGNGSTDYIETSTLGSFGSNLDTDFAFAFSAQFDSNGIFGTVDDMSFNVFSNGSGGTSTGEIAFNIQDQNGNSERVHTSGTRYDDGNPYRFVFNKKTNNASNFEIWVNQSEKSIRVDSSDGFSSSAVGEFNEEFTLLARNLGSQYGGGFDGYWDMILDDVCIFNDSLTQTEIESYTNPWE